MPDVVQGAVERLGDDRLGVTHQALELLTRRFDGRPSPLRTAPQRQPSRWFGQVDGPAGREDGGAPRRHLDVGAAGASANSVRGDDAAAESNRRRGRSDGQGRSGTCFGRRLR